MFSVTRISGATKYHIDGLAQGCGTIANALELSQSCTKPWISSCAATCGDVERHDVSVAHVVQVFHQGTQTVAVGSNEHTLAALCEKEKFGKQQGSRSNTDLHKNPHILPNIL